MKKIFKIIWITLLIMVGIFLIMAPFFVVKHLFNLTYLENDDWGNIIGGCLAYYGTVILGFVAVIQSQISLKQNERTFKSDKYSIIKIKKNCFISVLENSDTTIYNIHNYFCNAFCLSLNNKKIEYNPKEKLLCFKMNYSNLNSPINKLMLKKLVINYHDEYFIDNNVKTVFCEDPNTDYQQLELIFFLTNDDIKKFLHNINRGVFIMSMTFEIVSSFNVNMIEEIEVNFADPIETKEFYKERTEFVIASTSYTYTIEKKYKRRKK